MLHAMPRYASVADAAASMLLVLYVDDAAIDMRRAMNIT